MAHLKRIAATVSATALAGGTIMAGAGAAGAQDIGEVADDLQLASMALNGPVSVAPNAEGGPTVTYTNRGDEAQQCVGFTAPYSTIEENDIDPREVDPNDTFGSAATLTTIQGGGDTSALTTTPGGEPTAVESGLTINIVTVVGGFGTDFLDGVLVPAGETVTWNAPTPADEPASASITCADDDAGLLDRDLENYSGIDPQVVADQINDRLGPLGSVTAGSVSGGSVAAGAGLLGSLADDPSPEESDNGSSMPALPGS